MAAAVKVGRNDPCPCGSGRKYKNCHLGAPAEIASTHRLWRRQHELNQWLPTELLRFVKNRYGMDVLDEAWSEFTLYQEEAFDQDSMHLPVFMPWFFYEWDPDPASTIVPPEQIDEFPVASAYLKRRGRYEEPLTVRYLEAARDAAFSFLEILEVRPGAGFTMQDALSGWRGNVTEKTASRTLHQGDILLARVVGLDDLAVLDGCASIAFPPLEKRQIIELRNKILKVSPVITASVLRDHRMEVLEIYHSTAERLLNPKMPKLANTDGDPLAFCRVTYEIPSPRAAFESLRHLSLGHTEAELLEDATFDAAHELLSVELPWVKTANARMAWKNTSQGSIKIEGPRLITQVNSEQRAKKFRKIADKTLPAGSRYLSTIMESIEAALEDYQREHPEGSVKDDLNDQPEVQALLRQTLMDYYRSWLDITIPSLNGQTPKQAVKTNDGREMVEALLLDLERREVGPAGLSREIAAELRATLGLGQQTFQL